MNDSAYQSEVAVLGSCLVDDKAVVHALSVLKPEFFTDPSHEAIFKAIQAMHHKGVPIDVVTLCDFMGGRGAPAPYIMGLSERVPTALHVEHYAAQVRKKYLEGRIVEACQKAMDAPGDPERIAALRESIKALEADGSRIQLMPELLHTYQSVTLDERMRGNDNRVKSGFPTFDRRIGGFARGSMVVIGGRPSTGKSALLIKIAMNMLQAGVKVHMVSGEMIDEEILDRMMAARTNTETTVIQGMTVRTVKTEIDRQCALMLKWPFSLSVSGRLSLETIEADIGKIGPDVVMVDYLQRFTPPGNVNNRAAYFSDIANGLKNIAIEKKVVMLCASQLNRDVEHRADKLPTLSDLKESGGSEEAAHMVWLLAPKEKTEGSTMLPLDALIAKNRNGPKGVLPLVFHEPTADFLEREITADDALTALLRGS